VPRAAKRGFPEGAASNRCPPAPPTRQFLPVWQIMGKFFHSSSTSSSFSSSISVSECRGKRNPAQTELRPTTPIRRPADTFSSRLPNLLLGHSGID
jgi:hypothetical protein